MTILERLRDLCGPKKGNVTQGWSDKVYVKVSDLEKLLAVVDAATEATDYPHGFYDSELEKALNAVIKEQT